MNKIKLYQNAILHFLNGVLSDMGSNINSDVQYRILADYNNNSFQLLANGWNGKHYVLGPLFHFDIINNKIWMQCNNTEREVVDELMADGVLAQEIVLGFVPPYAQTHTGFAAA
jgi:XisI protein